MHTNHTIDDELQTSQTNTLVRNLGKIKSTIRITHVHHDFERQLRHRVDGVFLNFKVQHAFIDETGVAFGAGYGHALAVF